jgi:prepilin-type processing-associated H-X9-DG protein
MPFYLTLADFNGVLWDQTGRENMTRAAGTHLESIGGPFLDYYRCPADKTFELGNKEHAAISLIPGGSTMGWWTLPSVVPEMSSYIFNESVLGRSPSVTGPNTALQGKLNDVLFPSDVFIVTDGEPRLEWDDHLMTVWHDPNVDTWSMWQYEQAMRTVQPTGVASQFDYRRHSTAMNVGYADGHASAAPLRPSALEKVVIWHRRQ